MGGMSKYVTRAELDVLIEFLAPRGDPNACDGPSILMRGRRDWLDRALAEARGPVDDDAIRTEPASVPKEGVLMMVTRLGCGLPVSNEHCIAALRTELAAERTRAVLLVSKLDAARDRFDDIEATLEEWRRRDDAPRAGDALPPVSPIRQPKE